MCGHDSLTSVCSHDSPTSVFTTIVPLQCAATIVPLSVHHCSPASVRSHDSPTTLCNQDPASVPSHDVSRQCATKLLPLQSAPRQPRDSVKPQQQPRFNQAEFLENVARRDLTLLPLNYKDGNTSHWLLASIQKEFEKICAKQRYYSHTAGTTTIAPQQS